MAIGITSRLKRGLIYPLDTYAIVITYQVNIPASAKAGAIVPVSLDISSIEPAQYNPVYRVAVDMYFLLDPGGYAPVTMPQEIITPVNGVAHFTGSFIMPEQPGRVYFTIQYLPRPSGVGADWIGYDSGSQNVAIDEGTTPLPTTFDMNGLVSMMITMMIVVMMMKMMMNTMTEVKL